MSDTIYREDAIKAVKSSIADGWGRISPADACQNIRCLPSADRPQGWIPCSERLPDRYKRVLTTSKKGMVRENFINAGGWSYDTYSVVAWMPLPEPWKGADDENVDVL